MSFKSVYLFFVLECIHCALTNRTTLSLPLNDVAFVVVVVIVHSSSHLCVQLCKRRDITRLQLSSFGHKYMFSSSSRRAGAGRGGGGGGHAMRQQKETDEKG